MKNVEGTQRSLLDMVLLDVPPTIPEQVTHQRELYEEHVAIHGSYFLMMGMIDPKVVLFSMPPIKTAAGRGQLIQFVREQTTSQLPDKDFEILFAQVDQGQQD